MRYQVTVNFAVWSTIIVEADDDSAVDDLVQEIANRVYLDEAATGELRTAVVEAGGALVNPDGVAKVVTPLDDITANVSFDDYDVENIRDEWDIEAAL